MNTTRFRMEWKSAWKLLLIFILILAMYFSIMLTMFDPELGSALAQFEKLMPEMMAAVGMSGTAATLVDFFSTYLYGMIMIMFPFLFSVILSLRLLVKKVDNGSMTYLLSCGEKRSRVWMTQLAVLLSALFLLIAFCTLMGVVCSILMFPGDLDIAAFLRLNLGCLLLQTALASISFLTSSALNEYRHAALIGAGTGVVFIMIQMLANMKGNLEKLQYATIMTLFDTQGLIANEAQAWARLGVLLLIAGSCLLIARRSFMQRDLSL